MNDAIHKEINQRFNSAQHIVIASHIRPDGDAIGSTLGLGLALQNAGKKIEMVLSDGVPSEFRHLPGSNQITHRVSGTFDLVIVVDCSDIERVGGALNGVVRPDLIIDHHITNQSFGTINVIEPEAVATSSILTEYLPRWGLQITPDVASALLTGMVSDTLGFRTSNTTPGALRQAALLMEYGANLPDLYQRALISHSFEALKYWGQGLVHLRREDNLFWTSLTLKDREQAKYYGNDDADLVNLLSAIDNIDIAIVFVEQTDGKVKISWRSRPGIDVSQIAVQFGGGGHPAASGAEVTGQLEEVELSVLTQTRLLITNHKK
jgi:phosphoesterase RecJ-like protein